MKRIFLFLAAAAFFCLGLCGCSRSLSSDLYWSGSEKETKWVEKNVRYSRKYQSQKDLDSEFSKPLEPMLKNGKVPYKIGIVISGEYWEFYDNFKALIDGFVSIGWAHSVQIPSSITTTSQLISWLSWQNYSEYVEFSEDYFINLEWGDEKAEAELKQKYFSKKNPSVDAVIVYGGMAAKMFYANESYPLPVFADAITDSFGAGVTVSVNHSGRDFFSGKIDPDIYKQQLRLFAKATGLKSIGIVYGDDDYGRIYSAVSDVEEIAKEEGFEIIRNTNVIEDITDKTVELYLNAIKDVASKADAVYIGAGTAVTEYDIMDKIVEILDEAKKPSFALEGSIRVKDGILYSLSSSSMTSSGIYMATKLTHAFNGVKPRMLPQKFENTPLIAHNLYTAKKIGYKVPMDIFINSDEIYIDRNGTLKNSFVGEATSASGFSDFAKITETQMNVYQPHVKENGSKYKIGIVQSGSYWEFTEHFRAILLGLQQNGWINQNVTIPDSPESIEALLKILGDKYSDYISFEPSYNINLNWGDNMNRADKLKKATKNDIDLLIAFGGVAANFFTSYESYPVPVLVEAVNDPVATGISYSQTDSGRSFVTCRIDPNQYQRQIQLFHNLIGFKKLGIIYGDDEYGRLYSAVNDVEVTALKEGFEVIRNTNVKEKLAPDTKKLYLNALEDVCRRADAVYIGASTAVTEYDIIDDIVKILNKYKIPSFSLEGQIRVKDGILMGVSSLETEKIGLYNADKIAAILSGKRPRTLEQVFTGMPSIALNIGTAETIGLDIPLETLASIDFLYW